MRAGRVLLKEGDTGTDVYIIRRGPDDRREGTRRPPGVPLSYVPARFYVGEMAAIDGSPARPVKAAIRSEVIRLPGEAFVRLLESNRSCARRRWPTEKAARDRQLHQKPQGKTSALLSTSSLFGKPRSSWNDKWPGRSDRRPVDRREPVRRLRQLRTRLRADAHEGLSRASTARPKSYAQPPRADLVPPPGEPYHTAWPIARSNAIRRGRDGEVVISDASIRLRQLPAQLPVWRDRMDLLPPPKPR